VRFDSFPDFSKKKLGIENSGKWRKCRA